MVLKSYILARPHQCHQAPNQAVEEEAQFLHLLFETLSLRGSSRSIYQGGTGTAPGGSIGGAGMIDPEGKNKLGGPSIHLGGGGGTSLRGP